MKAKITARWDAVRPGDVYPTTFKPGDEVEGDLATLAVELQKAEPMTTAQISSSAPAPMKVRAKIKKGVEGYADGAIIEGSEAQQLIAEGKATMIKDKGSAPETK